MTRLFLATIAVLSALAAANAQKPTQKKAARPKSNQVYVKIIWPAAPATGDKDRPVVESWISEQLTKRGQTKFTAATAWVPLDVKEDEPMRVWSGGLDGQARACPVSGRITKRSDSRITVHVDGWAPIPGVGATISLKDEPGSRAIASVNRVKTEDGLPYVAVLVGPPSEKAAATGDR
ncbi:MAG TPA: hypothetical protein VFE62_27910 [Gemmataceae bacterium]|nr:hypothetical protein [Gemmataceae bacterium]